MKRIRLANKKEFFIILLLSFLLLNPPLISQDKSYAFIELKGMEDFEGNTHLFYRMYNKHQEDEYLTITTWDIYHLDLSTNTDTLFLNDYIWDHKFLPGHFTAISDLEFWHNDPAKYIYSGGEGVDEVTPFVRRYDNRLRDLPLFEPVHDIELSRQNDNIVYAYTENWYKSTDGGINWDLFLETNELRLLSLSPYNDSIFFANNKSELLRSTDGGINFAVVDSGYESHQFFYDSDANHIYSVAGNKLYVSDNKGEPLTWMKKYESDFRCIYLSVDYSTPGTIFLAEGKKILVSQNYGLSFNEFKILPEKIIGIYKKPASDILYAATKYKLYELTSDSISVIKNLQVNPQILDYYPLSVGNKWWYETIIDDELPGDERGSLTVEVTGDTVINSQHYFVLQDDYSKYCLRIDSLEGKVYRKDDHSEQEFLYDDLTAEEGDTVLNRLGWHALVLEDTITYFDSQTVFQDYQGYDFNGLVWHTYRLIKGFGIAEEVYSEIITGTKRLVGSRINGVITGDTVIVYISYDPLPFTFSLSQNYPNPFNPVTTINYSLGEQANALIKIYDILGNEIMTLINEEKPAGNYRVEFNGSSLASGIYFYTLTAGKFSQTKKLILLR